MFVDKIMATLGDFVSENPRQFPLANKNKSTFVMIHLARESFSQVLGQRKKHVAMTDLEKPA